MIISFKCADTQTLFETGRCKRFVNCKTVAERKLMQLEAAVSLDSLRAPPGNRKGQHSIRVNDQWRICFVWTTEGASDVEIVDYH